MTDGVTCVFEKVPNALITIQRDLFTFEFFLVFLEIFLNAYATFPITLPTVFPLRHAEFFPWEFFAALIAFVAVLFRLFGLDAVLAFFFSACKYSLCGARKVGELRHPIPQGGSGPLCSYIPPRKETPRRFLFPLSVDKKRISKLNVLTQIN